MNKKCRLIIISESIIVFLLAILLVLNVAEGKKEKETEEKIPITYVFLEKLQSVLNGIPQIADLTLAGTWDLYGMAAEPLYSITEEYTYQSTTLDGRIVSVSKYTQGTYVSDTGGTLLVRLIQDKTFENGGFIYLDDQDEENIHNVFYEYENCFIVCSYSADLNTTAVNNFLKDLTKIISENYEEIVDIPMVP